MEIKAYLEKPYTETQRLDFIVENNHNLGYEIRETEKQLQALDYTDEEMSLKREQEFKRQFFQTHLGWIRRKVTMSTGEIKDFLCDLLPSMAVGILSGLSTRIIAYSEPDYTTDVTNWEQYQTWVNIDAQFVQECNTQLINDFKPTNNINE